MLTPEDLTPSQKLEMEMEIIGKIGARLLAKHSPQAVLDAYFDAANEVLENNETNN
jgi:putative hemolysin